MNTAATKERIHEISPRFEARFAGCLYLLIILGGLFAPFARQGRLKPHRYNDSGAYLYEAPEAGSPLRSQDRKYRRGKSANQLIQRTDNEVQYEA